MGARVSERQPEGAQPEGAPPPAQRWYARMERQSAPPMQAGVPSVGGAPQASGPSTAVLPKSPPRGRSRRRDRKGTPPPGGPAGRPRGQKGNRDLVLWALAALVLGTAAVVAILFRDDLRGTSAAGSEGTTATDRAEPTGSAGEDPGIPADESVPTDTALPTTGAPTSSGTADDPLGIGVPMTPPACDGTWIVIVASAVDPATYGADVTAGLATDPSARYVLTQGQCASLRQSTADGGRIYAVYLGPYPDQASACATSTGIGNGAYVKRMDDTTPPDQTWEC